ncbi:MAG: hypothetical protein RR848_07505 [Oscillospiraceae bacterium]
MNGNTELLNFIYQNSQMGIVSIKQLLDIAQNAKFKMQLNAQYEEYKKINNTALKLLNENGCDEKGISAMDKMKTYLMVNMQTLTDKTCSHIAEMLIIGSNMGIVSATKNLKKYSNAKPDIISLMNKLLEFEENNVQRLKAFL